MTLAGAFRVVFLAFGLTAAWQAAAVPDGEEQIELVGEGRFEELVAAFEPLLHAPRPHAADLHGLCYAYHKVKRYAQLMQCLDRLEERIRAGDVEGRLFGAEDLTPYAAIMRAEAMLELGDPILAVTEAQRALDWFDREGGEALVEIDALAALAISLTRLGDAVAAREYVDRLDGVRTGFFFSNENKTSKSMALARSYMALGDYAKAYAALSKDFLFEANAFLDRLFSGAVLTGDNLWLWQDLPRQYMLGKSLLETGRRDEAGQRLATLSKAPQVRQNGEIYWQLLYDLGRIADAEGRLAEAADYYRRSVEVIERHRRNIDTEVNKIGFAADRQVVYAALVDALYRQRDYARMLQFVERAKSRALVDLLAKKWQQAPPGKLDATARARFRLLDELDASARQQGRGSNEAALGRLEEVREELFRADPMFASLVAVADVPAEQLLRGLREDETLLEYYLRGEDLYVIAADRGGIRATKLDGRGLGQAVQSFRTAISLRDADVGRQARALYDRLLRPLGGNLKARLAIVPHGPLHYLPFAALHDGQSWLVERQALRMLPSASVEALLTGPRRAAPSLLVLANPDTGNPAHDLRHAEEEAQAIIGQFPQHRLLVRAQATESAVLAEGPGASHLHLASHARFLPDDPLQSYLLLAPDRQNDGRLTADELYGMQLNADLVALSACQTGLGKGSAGDDVVGLTRGFFYAGARSLLASYWSVDDAATAELMRRFYERLPAAGRTEALREAQREQLAKRPEPFYWASFYLTGLGE